MYKKNQLSLLFALLVFELALQTYGLGAHNYYLNSISHVLASMMIGVITLSCSNNFLKEQDPSLKIWNLNLRKVLPVLWLPIMLLGIIMSKIFWDYRELEKFSDILPMMQILNERLLSGEYPYVVVTKWGYDFFPTFLPLHWMPFSFGILCGFDIRWIGLAAIVLCCFIIIAIFLNKSSCLAYPKLGVAYLLLFVPTLYALKDPISIGVTAELLVSTYYLVLTTALWKGDWRWATLGLIFCLLSRYSVVLFIPFILLIFGFYQGKKIAIKMLLLSFAGVLLIYILPFMIKEPYLFFKSYDHYTQATIDEWKGQQWQAPGEKPFQLYRGLGLAAFFHAYAPGDLVNKMNLCRTFHILFSLTTVALLSFYFWKIRTRIKHQGIFLLGGLKIYLTVFYSLIQIPYSYLYIVPAFISIICIMAVYEIKETESDVCNTPQKLDSELNLNE